MMTGIAVIGVGHWGPHLVRNFHDHPMSRVLWVVDADPSRLKAIGERFRDVTVTSDANEALGDRRVDAVVVATPSSTHFELAKSALDSGKHVLVEKPVTTTAASARQLCQLADAVGRVLMVGHVFLFNPAIRAAKAHIDRGDIGRLLYASMRRTNLGPVRGDVNAAWDLASHDISIANDWMGRGPVAVAATGGSWVNPGVEDAVFATLRYPADVLVHIEASWLNPRKMRQIAVVGESAMLTVDDMDLSEPLRVYDKGMAELSPGMTDTFAGFRAQIREGTITIPRVTVGEPLRAQCDAFLDRILGDHSDVSDGRAGLAVVEALEAMDRSLKEGGRFVDLAEIQP